MNDQLTSHLMEVRQKRKEWHDGLNAIDASYHILEHAFSQFSVSLASQDFHGPIHAYGYAKLVILETSTIRALLKYTFDAQTEAIDKHWPSLKIFRDAVAHLDERAKGTMWVKRKSIPLRPGRGSIAGGLAKSSDGKTWDISASCVFNFHFDGVGALTPLGMLDHYLLTNTDSGIEEIPLEDTLLDAVHEDLFSLTSE